MYDLTFNLLFYLSGLAGGISLGFMLAGRWAEPFIQSASNNLPASTPPPMPTRKAAQESAEIAAGMEAFRDFFRSGDWPKPGAKRSFPGGETGARFDNQPTAPEAIQPEGYNG